jgi:hypothetical protein
MEATMQEDQVRLEATLLEASGKLGLVRALSALAEMAPPWLERRPLCAWLPRDVRARFEGGATVRVAGAPLTLLSDFPSVRAEPLGRERANPERAAFDIALVLHRVLSAPDPVALLTVVRNGLKPDGACLVVEHAHPPEASEEARGLVRSLELAVALRALTQPPAEDLHRVPIPERTTPAERLARLARAAGFGKVEPLAMKEPLLLFRLER